MAKKKEILTEEQLLEVLNLLYGKALDGIPKVSQSVEEMVADYMEKEKTPAKAAKALANYQIVKCGTSGFLTGLGGAITLPVAIPANISSVLYVQLRMIAAIALIGGFDIYSDQVQTLVYACLTGTAMSNVLKQAGLKTGERIAISAIKKIPRAALTKINQKVGCLFITKFGTKGIVNLGKMVPLVGGVIGGGIDVATTKVIAANAHSLFITKRVPEEKPEKKQIEKKKKASIGKKASKE